VEKIEAQKIAFPTVKNDKLNTLCYKITSKNNLVTFWFVALQEGW
jgi:hypothetical protein